MSGEVVRALASQHYKVLGSISQTYHHNYVSWVTILVLSCALRVFLLVLQFSSLCKNQLPNSNLLWALLVGWYTWCKACHPPQSGQIVKKNDDHLLYVFFYSLGCWREYSKTRVLYNHLLTACAILLITSHSIGPWKIWNYWKPHHRGVRWQHQAHLLFQNKSQGYDNDWKCYPKPRLPKVEIPYGICYQIVTEVLLDHDLFKNYLLTDLFS